MARTEMMDPDAVDKMADDFAEYAARLKRVSARLDNELASLRSSFFIGLVGGKAYERYIEINKPKIDKLAAKYEELAYDLHNSAQQWRDAHGIS